jgi:hypothetical protein
VRAGRGCLEPGEEAGEGLLGHREFDVGVVAGAYLDDDAVRAKRRGLGQVGRTASDHRQRPAVEDLIRAEQHAQGAVPAELVALVGQDAETPVGARGQAQAALDGAAAPLKQVAAGCQGGRGEHDERQDDGEDPHRVR